MTQAFNLSQLANKVNSSGQLDVATGVTGTQAVANGGTGQTTYTNGQLLIGNTTGNTLTKSTLTAGSGVTITNGTGSITISAAAGQIRTELFTGPGTWTCPATTTQVRVTVIGGGGGTSPSNGGTSGGTSSFGSAVSATGGSVAAPGVASVPGTGTVSVGTALKTGSIGVPSIENDMISFGVIFGNKRNTDSTAAPAGLAYTTSLSFSAGAHGQAPAPGGPIGAGSGGLAAAIVPVSAPVTVTIGNGGAKTSGPALAIPGVGGAVAVEWVS